ncbi:MAG: FixG Ig-like domain-containing protein, partial [Gammaproteobacteria bacterium]
LQADQPEIRVAAGEVVELPVRLNADEADLQARSSRVVFELIAKDDPELSVQEEARFLGPR